MTQGKKDAGGFYDAAAITNGIARRDIAGLRAMFDSAFWGNIPLRPDWDHVVAALRQNDHDLLRLIAHRAAPPTEEALAALRVSARAQYPHYIKMLRRAGVDLPAAMANTAPYIPPDPNSLLHKIPAEWAHLLKTIRTLNAGCGAVIAGGALRDLFNDRPVRDVDIFIPVSGDKIDIKESDIWMFFNCADLKYTKSYKSTGGIGYDVVQISPACKNGDMNLQDGTSFKRHIVSTWNVETEPSYTHYNLVFIAGVSPLAGDFAEKLIGSFDVGLCQIAFDGKKVTTTAAYDADAANGAITLLNPNKGSDEHLVRIMKKYDGWQLCPAARNLLQQKSARRLFQQAFPGRKI